MKNCAETRAGGGGHSGGHRPTLQGARIGGAGRRGRRLFGERGAAACFGAAPGEGAHPQIPRIRAEEDLFPWCNGSKSGIAGKIPSAPFSGSIQSQGNLCQGNGKSVFRMIPLTNIPLTPLRFLPSSIVPLVAAGRCGRFSGSLWGWQAAQVANDRRLAKTRKNPRFSLDPSRLYAKIVRVTIGRTGRDGGGTAIRHELWPQKSAKGPARPAATQFGMARRLTQIDADADDTKEKVYHLRAFG
jgi:hypothetical protein